MNLQGTDRKRSLGTFRERSGNLINQKRSQNVLRTFPSNATYREPLGNVLLERSGNLINQKRSQKVLRTFPSNVPYREPIGNVTLEHSGNVQETL